MKYKNRGKKISRKCYWDQIQDCFVPVLDCSWALLSSHHATFPLIKDFVSSPQAGLCFVEICKCVTFLLVLFSTLVRDTLYKKLQIERFFIGFFLRNQMQINALEKCDVCDCCLLKFYIINLNCCRGQHVVCAMQAVNLIHLLFLHIVDSTNAQLPRNQ